MEEKKKESVEAAAAVEDDVAALISEDQILLPGSSLFDMPPSSCEQADPQLQKGTLGFLDMFTAQDFATPFQDLLFQNYSTATSSIVDPPPQPLPQPVHTVPEYSEVANTPATPNSSSMSSSSTEPAASHDQIAQGGGDDEAKTKAQLKPKRNNQKRQRQPRFAFRTKSDVDHLDDGYRWRKYGQKAVKNSPFPRSYYRCTSTACGVKKRVERSCEDPSIVVTTYEGTHTHPCPITPRGYFGILPETALFAGGSSGGGGGSSTSQFGIPPVLYPHQFLQQPLTAQAQSAIQQHKEEQEEQPYFQKLAATDPLSLISDNSITPVFLPLFQERPFCPTSSSSTPTASLPATRDCGLLQDMLPSQMLKDPKNSSRN